MAEPSVVEFWAMGSRGRVVIIGGPTDLAAKARALIDDLEQRWSRFIPTSEISSLNRLAGATTIVTPVTYQLISRAVQGHELTCGWFNPLMLDQLEQQGYRHPWTDERRPSPTSEAVRPASDETITLFPEVSAVRLPGHCRFDPGGIGKGLAVDLAIEACVASGATSASVELGGDLRVTGEPWHGTRWSIGVADPFENTRDVAVFTLQRHGAVTTSTTRKRRWEAGGRDFHHLLDPATGRPSDTDIVASTTCSSVTWWAEVAAKAALLAGSQQATNLLDDLDTPGIVVTTSGEVLRSDDASIATVGATP